MAWGGTGGIGLEYALTPAWSVKAEYDYLGFGRVNVGASSFGLLTDPIAGPAAAFAVPGTTASQDIQVVKLGLNYRWGANPRANWDAAPYESWPYPTKAPFYKAPIASWAPGWEFEGGGRYWYSSGRFQKDLGNTFTNSNTLPALSRLTYDGVIGNTGEFFGRVDTPWNIFVKGFVGAGGLSKGHMNDEDWGITSTKAGPPPFVGYSNTLSSLVDGSMNYATIDAGYNWLRGPGYKVGTFAGYNFYRDNKNGYGCVQIANQFSDCSTTGFTIPPGFPGLSGTYPPNTSPTSVLGITENDKWQSLRVGANSEVMLTERLKLTTDVALLPYVAFSGTDVHVAAGNVLRNEAGTGLGAQLEGELSYYVTPHFSIGAGGRYWAMWTTSGTTCLAPPAAVSQCGTPPYEATQYKTERYGAFVQAAYKFGAQ